MASTLSVAVGPAAGFSAFAAMSVTQACWKRASAKVSSSSLVVLAAALSSVFCMGSGGKFPPVGGGEAKSAAAVGRAARLQPVPVGIPTLADTGGSESRQSVVTVVLSARTDVEG